MRKTALLVTALAIALAGMMHAGPANAQRGFVSGGGSDSNPCTVASPCPSFQQAFNTVTAVTTSGGEIDVLDPAGYGPLTITHGISIQGHGFGGITQATSGPGTNAITINAGTSDAITLNGLLIDGADTGSTGIIVEAAGSVQILNCVIRHFAIQGINYVSSSPATLLVSDTIVSDNSGAGVFIGSQTNGVTLSGIWANNNYYGVYVDAGPVLITNSVLSNSVTGLTTNSGATWLAKTVVSGNGTGVNVAGGATVNSYGNNAINGNTTGVSGSLTPASTR